MPFCFFYWLAESYRNAYRVSQPSFVPIGLCSCNARMYKEVSGFLESIFGEICFRSTTERNGGIRLFVGLSGSRMGDCVDISDEHHLPPRFWWRSCYQKSVSILISPLPGGWREKQSNFYSCMPSILRTPASRYHRRRRVLPEPRGCLYFSR